MTGFLNKCHGELPFAPDYGAETDTLLTSIGVTQDDLAALRRNGVVA